MNVLFEQQLISIIRTNFDNDWNANNCRDEIDNIDWFSLIKTRKYTHILPIVYYTLKKLNLLDRVSPPQAINDLRKLFLTLTSQNLRLLNELGNILQALAEVDTRIMLLKGIALATRAYPECGLRPMNDIDLLIEDRSEATEIARIFRGLGYQPLEETPQDVLSKAIIPETTFCKDGRRLFSFDVHYFLPYLGGKPNRSGLTNTERVWQNAYVSNVGDHPAWLMCPEDTIPNLIGHRIRRHGEDSVILYNDLGFLCKTHKIDWSAIIDNMYGSLICAFAARSFQRARTEFGIQIPLEVVKNTQEISDSAGVLRNILATNAKSTHIDFLDSLTQTPDVTRKMTLVARYFFPPISYMKLAYQTEEKWRLALFYAYRPINMIAKSFVLTIKFVLSKKRPSF